MKGLACVGTTKVSLRRPWFHPEAVLYVPEDQGWRTRFLRNPLFFRILRIHAHVYFYIYIYIYLPGRPLSQERPLKTHPSPSDGVHRNMAACDAYARVKKFTRGVDFIQRTFYLTVNRPIGGDLGFGTLCSLDHRVRARTHLYFWIFSVSLQHALFSVLIPSKQGDLREEEQPPAILYERHSCLSEFPGYGGEENGNLRPRHIRKEYRCVSWRIPPHPGESGFTQKSWAEIIAEEQRSRSTQRAQLLLTSSNESAPLKESCESESCRYLNIYDTSSDSGADLLAGAAFPLFLWEVRGGAMLIWQEDGVVGFPATFDVMLTRNSA